MNETLEKIGELGIVPVVKIEKAEEALPLGRALIGLQPLAVARKSIPFVFVAILVLMAVTFIPWISEFLPSLMGG